MRHTCLFNFYLSKIKYKRPKVNSEPTHFLTLMNNGKVFSCLDGMACSYQSSDQFQFLPGLWQVKRYWVSWDLKNNPIYLKIILITPRIIWSLKFKTKQWWNWGITNNIKKNYKVSRYLFCCSYEQLSQINQCTWCLLKNAYFIYEASPKLWDDLIISPPI